MRSRARLLAPFALCLAAAACETRAPATSSADAASPAPVESPQAEAPSPAAQHRAPRTHTLSSPPPTAPELTALANANNAFALDLYAKVRTEKTNLALSPFSISTALAMTWAGARGETAAQMKKALHLDAAGERALDVAGHLVASYGGPDQKVTVRVANRLFGEKSYSFEQPYLSRIQGAFGAPLEQLDFKTAAEDARGRINGWVAAQTQNRIQNLIPPKGVDDQTRLVLTNAIYFLGDWATPFEKERTSAAPFSTGRAEQHTVPTMRAVEPFGYAAAGGVRILQLPYENGALAMTFVLPDAVDGLEALESKLTPDVLAGMLKGISTTRVIVSLPKFEIDPASSLSLGDTLKALGMPLPFDRGRADFTGIANPANPADRLWISKVFHKAFVRVDEKGTEAAAATAVVAAPAGAAPPSTQPPEFKADHPFLFLLRDTRSGLILFMGRVGDPASK
jgi:serpin B